MLLRYLIAASLTMTPGVSAAASAPEHSKIEVSQTDGLTFSFKVKPHAGMTVTLEAPWKLVVEDNDLTFPKNTLDKAEMNGTLPGFVVSAAVKPTKTKGTLKYTLTSFICTAAKTQCYREIHTGTFDWSQKTP